MTLTREDKVKAVKISRAIEKYLHDTGETMIRSTEVYEYLARNGLVPRDEGNGYYFRKFLKKLKREGALDLIPQCDGIDQNEIFTNWHFHSAGNKALKSVVIKQESTSQNSTLEDTIPLLKCLVAGLNPLTGKSPDNADFLNERSIRSKLLLVVDHLVEYCEDCPIPSMVKGYSETKERGQPSNRQKNSVHKIKKIERATKSQDFHLDEMAKELLAEVTNIISSLPLVKETESLHNHMQVARKRRRRAYEPWSEEEDRILIRIHEKVKDTTIIAKAFQRGNRSIIKRLEVLEVAK